MAQFMHDTDIDNLIYTDIHRYDTMSVCLMHKKMRQPAIIADAAKYILISLLSPKHITLPFFYLLNFLLSTNNHKAI